MLFALDICANKKAPPTHSVYWSLKPTSKASTPFFLLSPLLNLPTIQASIFRQFAPSILVFHTPQKIRFFSKLPY